MGNMPILSVLFEYYLVRKQVEIVNVTAWIQEWIEVQERESRNDVELEQAWPSRSLF